MRSKQEP
jgi:ribonuclease HI